METGVEGTNRKECGFRMIMSETVFLYEETQDEKADSVRITGVRFADSVMRIPEQLGQKKVSVIGKKAFWGCMGVQEVFVPESVEEIGDWAFASCKELRRVSLPRRDIRLGRGVFKGCERLECIELRNACMSEETGKAGKENKEEQADGTGYLLAAADRLLHNPYLFDIGAAGTTEWHRKWDASLQELMHMPEDEGFSKMLLCGEEDYGSRENNIDHYCAGQRKRKARAALLRLRHDTFLSGELRGELEAFLRAHALGCETADAWEALVEEHGGDRSYYDLFERAGGIHEKNRGQCIAALDESHTEIKAYLLGKTTKSREDFFDSLSF